MTPYTLNVNVNFIVNADNVFLYSNYTKHLKCL